MLLNEIATMIRKNIKGAVNITILEDGVKFTHKLPIYFIREDFQVFSMNTNVRCRTKASEGLQSYIQNFIK